MSDADATTAPAPKRRPGRALAVWILLVLASLLLLLSTFAVWVDRVALNTDAFVDTSTELIEDEAIRQAVANRAVDELFESVDVEAELEAQLPDDYQNLSGPAAAGLREASYTLVARALEQPRLQRLWAATLEESHRTLVAVLEGEGERVSTGGGRRSRSTSRRSCSRRRTGSASASRSRTTCPRTWAASRSCARTSSTPRRTGSRS